jgi:predicted enzyme related to lactoylglutathione lyase
MLPSILDQGGREMDSSRFGRSVRALGGLLVAVLLAGCSSGGSIPPLTAEPTNTYREGKVVWRDLLTHDVAGAKKFYSNVFGWDFTVGATEDIPYTTIYHRGIPIGGIVRVPKKEGAPNVHQWVVSISVPDVKAAVATITGSGGKVLVAPQSYGDRGLVAVVQDGGGAVVGLVRSRTGDPEDRGPVNGGWLWSELWTGNPPAAVAQYRSLLPYEADAVKMEKRGDYTVLKSQGSPRAGIMKNPISGARAYWMPYVQVEDPAATAKQAESQGGTALFEPRDDVRKGTVAIIADPYGGALAVQRYPL